jgi:hydroxymethylbilane synthase
MDALCSRGGEKLSELPHGCVVGTSSLRRQFQLLAARPDVKVVSIRGNVDTRLRKLAEGVDDVRAILLAVAGLTRLGLAEHITEVLDPPRFLPAIGQGAVGIESRSDDARVKALLEPIRHRETEICVTAERGVLERLEGDCHLPIACYATMEGEDLTLFVKLGSADGTEILEDQALAKTHDPRAMGFDLADKMLARGARKMIDDAKKP